MKYVHAVPNFTLVSAMSISINHVKRMIENLIHDMRKMKYALSFTLVVTSHVTIGKVHE